MIKIDNHNTIKISGNKKHIFLGGTCNNSTWRDDFIEKIDKNKYTYFNPVVKDWNEEAQKEEEKQKKNADYNLFVITPKMKGVFSIAEVVDLSNKYPEKVLFCILEKDENEKFDKEQIKSLDQTKKMVKNNGGNTFDSMEEMLKYLNNL